MSKKEIKAQMKEIKWPIASQIYKPAAAKKDELFIYVNSAKKLIFKNPFLQRKCLMRRMVQFE